jgi:hypothetical protein
METSSGTCVHAARSEYAHAPVEKLFRDERHVEQPYRAANCGLSAMCELAFGRISDGTLLDQPIPTPSTPTTQGAALLMANLESQWRLGLVPLQAHGMERRHLN